MNVFYFNQCLNFTGNAAGAQFFLTPSVSADTLEFCRQKEIPLLPEVMTSLNQGKERVLKVMR